MELETFYQEALRTINEDRPLRENISDFALGLAGECGEVVNELKKALHQGHILDKEHVKEELGDVFFYVAALCHVLDIPIVQMAESNIEKRYRRFPNGFTAEDSIQRRDTK